jgi:hypothetical protein
MRKGHSRPVGTTTRIRLFGAVEEPPLGAIVWDAPDELERAYRIAGVEEVARPGRWNLLLERLPWDAIFADADALAFALLPMPPRASSDAPPANDSTPASGT